MTSLAALHDIQPDQESTHQLILKMAQHHVSAELRHILRMADESLISKTTTSTAMIAQAKALVAMADQHYDQARSLFSRSAENAPHKADCVLGYAHFLCQLGYRGHALDFAEYCRTRISNGTEYIILIDEWRTMSTWLAKQYAIHAKRYDDAINICIDVLQAQPNDAQCLRIAADCCMLLQNWSAAKKFVQRLEGVLPKDEPTSTGEEHRQDVLDLIAYCSAMIEEHDSSSTLEKHIRDKRTFALRDVIWLWRNGSRIKASDIASNSESVRITTAVESYIYVAILIISGLDKQAHQYIEESTLLALDTHLLSASRLKLMLGTGNLSTGIDIAKKSFRDAPYQAFYLNRYTDCLRLNEHEIAPQLILCEQLLSQDNEAHKDQLLRKNFISKSMKFLLPGDIGKRLSLAANATCNQPIARAWIACNDLNIFSNPSPKHTEQASSQPNTVERTIEETLDHEFYWLYSNLRSDQYLGDNRYTVTLEPYVQSLPENLRRNYLLFVGMALSVGLPNIAFLDASKLRENIERFSIVFSNDVGIDRIRSITDMKIAKSDLRHIESLKKELNTPVAELQTLTLHWIEQCYFTIARLVLQFTGDIWSVAKLIDFLFQGDLIEHDSMFASTSYGPEATKMLTYFSNTAFQADENLLFNTTSL